MFLALSNFGAVVTEVRSLVSIIKPFIIGIGIAYLLNMPMRFFERKLFAKLRYKRVFSILLVYLISAVLVVLLIVLVLPQLADSVWSLVSNIPMYISNLNGLLLSISDHFDLPPDVLDAIIGNSRDIANEIMVLLRNTLPDILNWTVRFGSGIFSILTAIIASVYMLTSKEKLLAQCVKVMYTLLPKRRVDETRRVLALANKVFSGFIGGKLVDSAIIGAICYLFMWVTDTFFLEMPMGLLISVIIAITNVIPFFGPFIGAIPSVVLLLLINPWSAVCFTVFVIVLQQFDGNFLGPKILGGSTGLPAFWVLVALIIGGGLFGFAGMLLGVPTVAVLYTLFSDYMAARLRAKGLDAEGNTVPPPPEADAAQSAEPPQTPTE